MIKLNEEWYIQRRDHSQDDELLHHTPCLDKDHKGYVYIIEYILHYIDTSKDFECCDCNAYVPKEVLDKIKFIYAKNR